MALETLEAMSERLHHFLHESFGRFRDSIGGPDMMANGRAWHNAAAQYKAATGIEARTAGGELCGACGRTWSDAPRGWNERTQPEAPKPKGDWLAQLDEDMKPEFEGHTDAQSKETLRGIKEREARRSSR